MPSDVLLTTAQAAALATRWRRAVSDSAAAIRPATIRKWASRGHLAPAGLTEHDHPLYDLADLARAERATRARALRLVGIGTTP